MANKKYTMVLSSEESKDVLGMLRKSLRNAEKMIEEASSNIKEVKLKTPINDEVSAGRINKLERRLSKIKVWYSLKSRFTEHLEKKVGDNDICIITEIKIVEKDVKQTPEDEEEPNCDDCLYNDINFGCSIGRKIIDGKCKFYT